MRRLIGTIAALTATATLAAACGGSAKSSGSGGGGPANYATDGTFTMALPSDVGPFDPYRSVLILSYMGLAYDSLVNLTPDGQIASGLAEKWDADANQATFTLKAGVTCSDGTPLTASQVAKDLDFVKDPKNTSPLYGTLVPTVPFMVTADDAARTVHIAMQQPYGFLLRSIGSVPIVCAKGMADPSMLKSASSGTGPFVLTSVVPGASYTFAVRKGYVWGPDGASTDAAGTPAKVVLKVITNETTAANLLASGGLNAATVAGPDQQRLAAQGFAHLDSKAVMGELWFNQRDNRPASDLRVRRALTMALDLDQLSKVSTAGRGTRSTGLVALEPKPCSGNTVEGTLPAHDPTQAASLLDQAGWTKGSNGARSKDGKPLKLDLHYTTLHGETGAASVELVANEWKALGAQVTLTADDANALNRAMFQTGDFDAYWDGYGFNLPTQVVPFVSGAVPPQGQNFVGIHNADYERLAAQAAAQPAPQACTLWNQAEQALFRDLDVVPVSDTVNPTFLTKAQMKSNGFEVPIPTSIRVLR